MVSLQEFLLILVFLVVVFCGEDVVICVADVVFWQSLFMAQKIRHCFVKYFDGWLGLGGGSGLTCIFLFYA